MLRRERTPVAELVCPGLSRQIALPALRSLEYWFASGSGDVSVCRRTGISPAYPSMAVERSIHGFLRRLSRVRNRSEAFGHSSFGCQGTRGSVSAARIRSATLVFASRDGFFDAPGHNQSYVPGSRSCSIPMGVATEFVFDQFHHQLRQSEMVSKRDFSRLAGRISSVGAPRVVVV